MSNINQVIITGNLTRDPELRNTSGNFSVLSFTVACNDRRKNGDQWEDVPNFFDVVVFGNRADALARFLRKGAKVAVLGKLRWSQWEKDGQKRSKIDVIASDVEVLSSSKSKPQEQAQDEAQAFYMSDEIPF